MTAPMDLADTAVRSKAPAGLPPRPLSDAAAGAGVTAAAKATADVPAEPAAATPLLQLDGVSRIYTTGGTELRALDQVSLAIHPGEFVAIIGQSGSGKSTLMNILGCLDRPSEGRYTVRGQDVAELDPDQLAALRRDTFGFVFQRYNLLSTVSAAENVELPAIYAGRGKAERRSRAHALLERLGLGDRAGHRPNQLSGGQQQRVSIARALINGAEVILADEPTGALDSKSGQEVLALLSELHAEGRTILLITHDAEVAAHAERIIQIKDGRVIEDSGPKPRTVPPRPEADLAGGPRLLPDLAEAVKMALRSLRANLFRSALTLLGVVIGVAAVVAMLAIGNGSKEQVMQRIESMGTNLLMVFPGSGGRSSGAIATLTDADAEAVAELDQVVSISPERSGRSTLRFGNVDYQTNVVGVWPGYMQTQDWSLSQGSFITSDDVRGFAPVIVLGETVARTLFPGGGNPVGRYVLVGNIPFEVIGVLSPKGANAWGSDQDDVTLVPLSTGYMRLFGQPYLSILRLKFEPGADVEALEESIKNLLIARHGSEDFRIRNTSSIMETAAETQNTLTVLLGSVAAISLLVGGIGVMNIMLMNVTERTREIGVRMATGARRSSILLQFNTEALVVCGIGGVAGVALGFGAGYLAQALGMNVAFTASPALLAFCSAFFTGLLFGFLPARKAANMDPVAALATE